MGRKRIKFWEFIAKTPGLYDGSNLDSGTIDYINLYFWDYKINPLTFPREFFVALKRAVPTYNNLKGVEMMEGIDSLTTSKAVRESAQKTINNLTKTANGSDTTAKSGYDQTDITGEPESHSYTEGDEDTSVSRDYSKTTDSNVSKSANKDLPMRNVGNFDTMTAFDNGASIAGKSKSEATKETNREYSDHKGNSFTTDESQVLDQHNRISYHSTITKTDGQTIKDTGSIDASDTETVERIDGLTADLVRKIWNYLVSPKAIDYLVDELSKCFILVC